MTKRLYSGIMLNPYPRMFTRVAIALSLFVVLPAMGQVINEDFKLLPSDGAASDWFGISVAISGTTAVVGAVYDDDNGTYSGSAYLFDTTTGQQLFKLLPNDGAELDNFGFSVAISGTTAVVGAWWDDDNGSDSGSAYLFDTTTGQQLFKLLPSDGSHSDQFGWSVAISGNTAVVGAFRDDENGDNSGSAYVFIRIGEMWFQQAKLVPKDGMIGEQFGIAVSISGNTIVIGASRDDDSGIESGSAYLFDTTTGQQIAKLLASDGAANDLFGWSVAISGTTAVVGALGDDDNGDQSGSAYLFDTTTGQQIAKLLPGDGAELDYFGYSVAISGSTAMVGSYRDDDNGSGSGSAYLFDTTTGQQIGKLLPSDGSHSDQFGSSVAISGNTAVVGARWDDDNGNDSGSAYVFTAPPPCPPADLNGDRTLDFLDVSAYLSAFSSQNPIADFTGDGQFNFFDVSAFLSRFSEGCP